MLYVPLCIDFVNTITVLLKHKNNLIFSIAKIKIRYKIYDWRDHSVIKSDPGSVPSTTAGLGLLHVCDSLLPHYCKINTKVYNPSQL